MESLNPVVNTETTDKKFTFVGYKSDISIRALASSGLNGWAANTSSQRMLMDASHLKQHLVLIDGDRKRWFTGVERNYSEQAFMVKFHHDCVRVIEVISKYAGALPKGIDSPMVLIVYERLDDHVIDVIEMPSNFFEHQTFGFMMEKTKVGKEILKQKAFPAGTILAKPPTITDDMDYKYGKELHTYFSDSTSGIEDGSMMSREAAYGMRTMAFGEVDMYLDKHQIMLNLNGDDRVYKPIPDIGDFLRDDGLVMGNRTLNKDYPMAMFNKYVLQSPNQIIDSLRYGESWTGLDETVGFKLDPGLEYIIRPQVIDVKVIRGVSNRAPISMAEQQLQSYWERTVRFHENINRCHQELERRNPGYELSGAWQRYVDDSYFYTNQPTGVRHETFKKKPLAQWWVSVKFKYVFIPVQGAKFTTIHGGKTVLGKLKPRDEMPRGPFGPVDIVMEGISKFNRMNLGTTHEARLGNIELGARRRITDMFNAGVPIDEIFKLYERFIEIVSPTTLHVLQDPNFDKEQAIMEIMEEGIDALFPPGQGGYSIEIITKLQEEFPVTRGPILILNNKGEWVQTEVNGETGVVNFMMLERSGQNFSASASARRQNHGIPTKANKSDKQNYPVKISSTRFPDEATSKSMESYLNNDGVRELLSRSLDPLSHRVLTRSLVRHKNPAKLLCAVDRRRYPMGGNRVVALFDNYLITAGIEKIVSEDGNSV